MEIQEFEDLKGSKRELLHFTEEETEQITNAPPEVIPEKILKILTYWKINGKRPVLEILDNGGFIARLPDGKPVKDHEAEDREIQRRTEEFLTRWSNGELNDDGSVL